MPHYKYVMSLWGLGSVSLLFGVLGAIFFWWAPMGIVLSIIGLIIGLIGITASGRSAAVTRLLIGGMLASLAALIFDSVIAGLGLEILKLHALR